MHHITFVGDDELPDGHNFVLVQTPLGAAIFYRESAVTPAVLEDSWAAYRSMRTTRPASAVRRSA